ncbi:hypothetical protein ACSLBF_02120 [Pseudoalteromonas sp. T1lg65]|uniref:hypothetical protein n=1 Tax=Pseudoalteromonas sp. T1lg65 TaxID=2077101 RepID=UPI003F79C828
MNTGRILILGNMPIARNLSDQIDGFDRVVRFNFCQGLPAHLGQKCTDLWLSSRGKQALKLANQFPNIKVLEQLNVMFTDPKPSPFSQWALRLIRRRSGVDYAQMIAANLPSSANINRICSTQHASFMKHLLTFSEPGGNYYGPSSGTLAIHHFLQHYQNVTIAGFGFEGWKRHPWQQEKNYVLQLISQHRIRLLASDVNSI